jgi:hypothetical protein
MKTRKKNKTKVLKEFFTLERSQLLMVRGGNPSDSDTKDHDFDD